MQEDTSSPLTELLDGGTIFMDICKIQGLNRYFAKFRDNLADWWKFKDEFEVLLERNISTAPNYDNSASLNLILEEVRVSLQK